MSEYWLCIFVGASIVLLALFFTCISMVVDDYRARTIDTRRAKEIRKRNRKADRKAYRKLKRIERQHKELVRQVQIGEIAERLQKND